jgi:GNAT superfamily N-acetyltransferase
MDNEAGEQLPSESYRLIHFENGNIPSEEQAKQILDLYTEVFSEAPWQKPDLTDLEINEKLERNRQAVNEMVNSLSIPGSSLNLDIVESDGKVVGFAWGSLSKGEEVLEYFNRTPDLKKEIKRQWDEIADNRDQYYLLSEIGVTKPKRGLGFGTLLIQKQVEKAESLGYPIFTHTRVDSSLPASLLKNGFIQLYGYDFLDTDKDIEERRVIIGTAVKTPRRAYFYKK